MSSKPSIALLVLMLTVTQAPSSLARCESPEQQRTPEADQAWLEIQKTAPGAELIIESRQKNSIRGRFVAASDASLSLFVDNRTFEIDRGSILKIYGVRERSRSKSTLVGGAVGLAAGIGVGVLIARTDNTGDANLAPVSLGVVGTLAGATIGALSGGKRRGKLLYSTK